VADQEKVHESPDKQSLCQESSIKRRTQKISSENMEELNEKMEKH